MEPKNKTAADEVNKTASADSMLEEPCMTMLDVLEEEKELEEEYAAVLGASDEKRCTYTNGPVKRQALYSCLTCCPDAKNDLSKCAGVCLACSYQCHENHELVELYTKRNFRCDCPTVRVSRDGINLCRLNANFKEPLNGNMENQYNQNFQGLYCSCHRPYPDPELTREEVMLQCVICEDWFHLQHFDDIQPNASKLMEACCEMICHLCMIGHSFLRSYAGLALHDIDNDSESTSFSAATGIVGNTEDNDNKLKSDLDRSISDIMNMSESEICSKRKLSADEERNRKKQKLVDDNIHNIKCSRPVGITQYEKGPTFWGSDWRAALCKCVSCMQIYKEENVVYLLDSEDTVKSYEERGIKRSETESSYEQGIRALASIDRVQQIDVITEYNRMKDKLKEFLQTFAANKKVVTEEDINRFFSEIRNEKNVEVGLPYLCR